jgi:hypothetical protein
MNKTKDILKAYIIVTLIEGIIRSVLIYIILILIPAMILMRPIVITRTFLEILIICLLASAFRMYVISPILITLAYVYTFFITASNLNAGLLSYNWEVLTFQISFSLDVSPLLFALFATIVIPMSISAFYSYYITQATGNIRRPPMPLTGATIRDIILEILR